jgi:hypothetical protein
MVNGGLRSPQFKPDNTGNKMSVAAPKKISDKEQAWLDEEVTFEFYNIEEPGSDLQFSFGPANNIKNYHLKHGQRYKYPRRVVNHIESKGPGNWALRPDGQGGTNAVKEGIKPRFQCKIIFDQF